MFLDRNEYIISFILSVLIIVTIRFNAYISRAISTIPRDLYGLLFLILFRLKLTLVKFKKYRLYDLYERTIEKFGHERVACVIDDVEWTFGNLKDFCDTTSNIYLKLGLKEGDHIALYSETTAFYTQMWLAADKLGISTGLINIHLKNESLIHSINEIKPKLIISSSNLAHNLEEISSKYKVVIFDEELTTSDVTKRSELCKKKNDKIEKFLSRNSSWISFDKLFSEVKPLGKYTPLNYSPTSPVLYIFTSGTTGMPKAAVITLPRFILMSYGPYFLLRMNSDDVLYTTLPLYHTAGGLVGAGQLILFGIRQVLRKKFSASQFWKDCVKYECTIAQYIGEICRYLLAQPNRDEEKAHKIRLIYGNGMRPKVWKEFVERFNIPQVGEFYGATESCANFINTQNKFGAIGFSSIIFPWAYPVYLVKTDPITGELERDPQTGLCLQVGYNQPGQLVGKVKNNSGIPFDGYLNKKDSSKKIVYNVFKKGDAWFLTGDLLEQDEYGNFYFKDRLGDTFRWRGENVSTNEVESIISQGLKMNDCVVFGVEIPNCEGRAGMAAIVLDDEARSINSESLYLTESLKNSNDSGIYVPENQSPKNEPEEAKSQKVNEDKFDRILSHLKVYMSQNLPAFAQPIFIRICKNITLTGTFKMKKVNLMKEGFDPNRCKNDFIYYFNSLRKKYEPLNKEIFEDIKRGIIRF